MNFLSQLLLVALFIEGISCCYPNTEPSPKHSYFPFKKRDVGNEDEVVRKRRDLSAMDEGEDDYVFVMKHPHSEDIKVKSDGSFFYKGIPYNSRCVPNFYLDVGAVAPKFENCRKYYEIVGVTDEFTDMRIHTCEDNMVFNSVSGECEISDIPVDCIRKCDLSLEDVARHVRFVNSQGRYDYKNQEYDEQEEELSLETDFGTAVTEGIDVGGR